MNDSVDQQSMSVAVLTPEHLEKQQRRD